MQELLDLQKTNVEKDDLIEVNAVESCSSCAFLSCITVPSTI